MIEGTRDVMKQVLQALAAVGAIVSGGNVAAQSTVGELLEQGGKQVAKADF